MNNKLKPALIGGIFIGVLSVIPFVSAANLCCCLWAILGGMLATYLYVKNSPTPAGAGDGAVLGVIAGVVDDVATQDEFVGASLKVEDSSAVKGDAVKLVVVQRIGDKGGRRPAEDHAVHAIG